MDASQRASRPLPTLRQCPHRFARFLWVKPSPLSAALLGSGSRGDGYTDALCSAWRILRALLRLRLASGAPTHPTRCDVQRPVFVPARGHFIPSSFLFLRLPSSSLPLRSLSQLSDEARRALVTLPNPTAQPNRHLWWWRGCAKTCLCTRPRSPPAEFASLLARGLSWVFDASCHRPPRRAGSFRWTPSCGVNLPNSTGVSQARRTLLARSARLGVSTVSACQGG